MDLDVLLVLLSIHLPGNNHLVFVVLAGGSHTSLQALLVNEFAGETFTCSTNSSMSCIETGEQVLQMNGVSNVVIWQWVLVLVGMIFGYHFLTLMVIKYLHKEKR